MEKRDEEGRITMTVDEFQAALLDAAKAGVRLNFSRMGQKGGKIGGKLTGPKKSAAGRLGAAARWAKWRKERGIEDAPVS